MGQSSIVLNFLAIAICIFSFSIQTPGFSAYACAQFGLLTVMENHKITFFSSSGVEKKACGCVVSLFTKFYEKYKIVKLKFFCKYKGAVDPFESFKRVMNPLP